jgi:DNA-binding transcriptional LysR family regulator
VEAGGGRRGLDLRQLEIFVEVAAAGSMTAAAQRLRISQAAVSQQIAKLEERLGVVLLERSWRDVRVTAAGARLRDQGRHLLADARDLCAALDDYRDFELPSLRLHVLESLASVLVPALVPRLRSRVGRLDVYCALQFENEDERIFAHDSVAITSVALDAVRGAGTRALLTEPCVAVVPADYAVEPAVAAATLHRLADRLPFLKYFARRRMAGQVESALRAEGLSPASVMTVDSSPAMLSLVGAGVGWTITAASCLLTRSPGFDDVAVLPLPRSQVRRSIVLIADDERLAMVPDWLVGESLSVLEREGLPRLAKLADWLPSTVSLGRP